MIAQKYDELGKRIYKIRNAIVNTKKYESESIFIPTADNFKLLDKDIKLIRLLSYELLKQLTLKRSYK